MLLIYFTYFFAGCRVYEAGVGAVRGGRRSVCGCSRVVCLLPKSVSGDAVRKAAGLFLAGGRPSGAGGGRVSFRAPSRAGALLLAPPTRKVVCLRTRRTRSRREGPQIE